MESLDLTQMVKTSEEDNEKEQNLDLPEEEMDSEEIVVEETPVETISYDAKLIQMSEWFDKNSQNFINVRQVKVDVTGVDPNDSLIFSVNSPKGGKDSNGNDKKDLYLFKNSKNMIVPDLTPNSFDVYSNGFKIIYNHSNKVIKCYVLKTCMILVYCTDFHGVLIPFMKEKVSKNVEGINIFSEYVTVDAIEKKLEENVDTESLQIKYKQIQKDIGKIKTNKEAIVWIVERQANVYDVNHLLQLDDLMISIIQ